MNNKGFSYFEHPSDIGIECQGNTLLELLVHAATALYGLMIDVALLQEKESYKIEINAVDAEDLFSQWIGELIFHAHAHHLFFIRFEFQTLSSTCITATAFGQKSTDSVRMQSEVKGITYHNYSVTKSDTTWQARFIIDV